jgi:hypothetical protein
MSEAPFAIEVFSAPDLEAHLSEMGAMMAACVRAGASIGYVLPYEDDDGETFWRQTIWPSLAQGGIVLLVARLGGRIAGTVQLDANTPPNQPHRAEVRKMLVHPDFRRKGIARALMLALEGHARQMGLGLLTLDTRTGDAAEPLYRSLGYETTGIIPNYCIDAIDPTRVDSTTVMYKLLD